LQAKSQTSRLYQIKGDDHEEQDDHPLLDLLEGVNENMTGIELKYVTMAHLELTGNCYWLLDGVTDAISQPRAIYPLNPVNRRRTLTPPQLSHNQLKQHRNLQFSENLTGVQF
jgi:phage portal protein BeeE